MLASAKVRDEMAVFLFTLKTLCQITKGLKKTAHLDHILGCVGQFEGTSIG